ncbi:ankyrin repeat protein [Aspergillus flavus]|uniref:Ankyrin repeat-containing domain-containing protein n=2 Tax=Aspergillus subgen. Circumdati TaxID=2720871 RepID=A0A1S9D6Y9_ASPOZ|nr:uncharacterized protein G4B84_002453 [Aspergillus flavus NRRL3357]KAJ1706327.1 ankyrin repeat protein [Aspergillus flavus]OOO04841.1 Ankyrin repeat-containing domain-containing protein [Aspergillus oryzae]QMW27164.1 hypothetical protein G4B84_002453 [Aspergillus flavus NRRL3357]QMW39200.1 hypothetical protein G4B11_002480 [Aspergillus flavus]RAQ60852.1 ankyrin repeat protein [Aspergillus flavus]
MSLHNDAWKGTLDRASLTQYLSRGVDIDGTSTSGDTPLALAVKNGQTSAVKLLLQAGANPNKKGADGKTPLYLVAFAKDKRDRLAQLLVAHGADVNEPVPAWNNSTPLMVAITEAKDPKLISLLVEKGASLTQSNDKGETAKKLAGYSMNPAIQRAILPPDQQDGYKPELGNLLTSSGLFAIAYFSNWKDVAKDSIDRISDFLNWQSNTDINSLRTEDDFKTFLFNFIQDKGLEDFYPPNDQRVIDIARAAAAARKNPSVRAMSGRTLAIMAASALYTPVWYCDDSGSMGGGTGRIENQRILVARMARIMGFVNPQAAAGVASLRFINADIGNADNLTEAQVNDYMNQTNPNGATPIGTNLKKKILDPLIHNVLSAGQNLPKPYLIMTITDGAPNEENKSLSPLGTDNDVIRSVIADAVNALKTHQPIPYSPDAVSYTISQIGDDQNSKAFLAGLKNNPVPDNVLYVTSESLDSQFADFKNNLDDLDNYLYNLFGKMLNIP